MLAPLDRPFVRSLSVALAIAFVAACGEGVVDPANQPPTAAAGSDQTGVPVGSTVALAGTLGALLLTLALAALFFQFSRFTGLASTESLILPFLATDLDMTGLLLGGAVIGSLGALDDVTVTQVATVAELHNRNPKLSRAELITSGIRVGREHIASTVNTLLLAYAGASMPILLGFAISNQSLAKVANSEVVAVEVVRTLCGSIGLVAAVPITTGLAALVVAGTRPHTDTHDEPDALDATPNWDDFAPEGDSLA